MLLVTQYGNIKIDIDKKGIILSVGNKPCCAFQLTVQNLKLKGNFQRGFN